MIRKCPHADACEGSVAAGVKYCAQGYDGPLLTVRVRARIRARLRACRALAPKGAPVRVRVRVRDS